MDLYEDPKEAVIRELFEETCLVGVDPQLLCVASDPKRDQNKHVISLFYTVRVEDISPLRPSDDAMAVAFVPLAVLGTLNLAFDHKEAALLLLPSKVASSSASSNSQVASKNPATLRPSSSSSSFSRSSEIGKSGVPQPAAKRRGTHAVTGRPLLGAESHIRRIAKPQQLCGHPVPPLPSRGEDVDMDGEASELSSVLSEAVVLLPRGASSGGPPTVFSEVRREERFLPSRCSQEVQRGDHPPPSSVPPPSPSQVEAK